MHLSLISLLLALLGQPLAIVPPDMTTPLQFTWGQPALMALTSRETYQLKGSVASVKLWNASLLGTGQSQIHTMDFDTHGYLTKMVCSLPDVKITITSTIVNQYDAQDRLKQLSLTLQAGDKPDAQGMVAVQHIYDDQGRLSEMSATLTDSTEGQHMQLTLQIPITFNDNGRIAKRSLLAGANGQMETAFESAYHYEADGRTIVESKFDSDEAITQRQWFNAQGKLAEWHTFDEQGHVKTKTFMSYNTQGDPQRISQYSANWAGQWTRITFYAYIYDKQGNWIQRTLSSLRQQDGKDNRLPVCGQFREITYYPEEPKAE